MKAEAISVRGVVGNMLQRVAGVVSALRSRPVLAKGLPVLLFAMVFAVYMGNGRAWPSGDTVPGRLLPISLLVEGDFDLDEFESAIYPGKRYCMITHEGRRLPSYSMGAGLTALPIYAAANVFTRNLFGDDMRSYFNRRFGDESSKTVPYRMEKIAAAQIAALSALFIFLGCRYQLSNLQAVVVSLAYALGTSIGSSASQALWSHGPAALAIAVMLWVLLRPQRSAPLLVLAGAAAGWAFFCRPTHAVPLAILVPWVVAASWKRGRWFWFGAGTVVVLALTSWLNYSLYGHILGGAAGRAGRLSSPQLVALTGILFSPSRGLFVFSPFLLVSFVFGGLLLFTRPLQWGGACWLASVASIVLYAGWVDWGAGFSFGPRLLSDVVPFLIVPLIPAVNRIRQSRGLYSLFLLLVALSMVIHLRGMYGGDGGWNARIYREQRGDELWNIKDSQYLRTLGVR